MFETYAGCQTAPNDFMSKTATLLITAAFMLASCAPGAWRTRHGVLVGTADGAFVRVEVVTDDIIHVEAVPSGGRLPNKNSLMVVPQKYGT